MSNRRQYEAANSITVDIDWAEDGWAGRVDSWLHRHGLTRHRPLRWVCDVRDWRLRR